MRPRIGAGARWRWEEVGAHEGGGKVQGDAGERIAAVGGGGARRLGADDGGEEGAGDAPGIEARDDDPARFADGERDLVDHGDVLAVAVEDDEAGLAVGEQAIERFGEEGFEGRAGKGDGAGGVAEEGGDAVGDDGGDERVRAERGGALGDGEREGVGEEEVSHRGVRALVLVTAEGDEDDGAGGEALARLGRGEMGEQAFRHASSSMAARERAWTPSPMQASSGW